MRKRKYVGGKNVTVSIRLPTALKEKLEDLAKDSGYKFSDFVQEGLDQWAEINDKNREK